MISEKIGIFNRVIQDGEFLRNPMLIADADFYLRSIERRVQGDRDRFAIELADVIIQSFTFIALDESDIPEDRIMANLGRAMHIWSWTNSSDKAAIRKKIVERLNTRPVPLKKDAVVEIKTQNELLLEMFEKFEECTSSNITDIAGQT